MKKNDVDVIAKAFGGVIKALVNEVVDKAVDSANVATETVKSSVDDIRNQYKSDVQNDTGVKVQQSESQLALAFMSVYRQDTIPQWDNEKQRFTNDLIQESYEYFKLGYKHGL